MFLLPACAATVTTRTKPEKHYLPDTLVLYQQALDNVKADEHTQPDYPAAIKQFKKFRKTYPQHPRTPEAGYWVDILEKIQALKKIGLETIRP